MFFLGSAYPLGKFGLNSSVNPILFGALRMGIAFLCLIPFCKIKIPSKKYFLPLIGFSISMGVAVNFFLYVSIDVSNILAPITIGAQLSIPFAIILSSIFLKESISLKKWLLIIASFLGIILIAFDPKVLDEILGFLLICGMAFFYGLSQVFSRYLKELDVKFTNAIMSFIGFIVLFYLSNIFEGNVITKLNNIDLKGWLADRGLNSQVVFGISDENSALRQIIRLEMNKILANRFSSRKEERLFSIALVEPFTIENGLLTQTLKQKREKIIQRDLKLINKIYDL